MTDSRAVLDLARRLAALERSTKTQAVKPQLGFSSLDGRPLGINDEYGADRGSLGLQYDGTYVAVSRNGPVPPTPAAATVAGGAGFLTASWDGNFAGVDGVVDPFIVAPEDYARTEVHVAGAENIMPDVAPESTTRKATIETAAGADVVVAADVGDYWVRLVTRTLSGAFSAPSVAMPATVSAAPTSADVTATVNSVVDGIPVLNPSTEDTMASVTPDGSVQGTLGAFDTLTVGGADIMDLLNALPRPLQGYAEAGVDKGPYTTETGYFEAGATIGKGRMVKVSMRCTVAMTASGASGFGYKIRGTYTSDGSDPPAPLITSPIYLTGAVRPRDAGDFDMSDFALVRNLTGADVNVRLLLTGIPSTGDSFTFTPNGTGTSYWGDTDPPAGNIILIEDVGPDMDFVSAYTLGGATGAPPPDPTPPPQTYTKTTAMSWSAVMDQNGLSNSWDGGTYLIGGQTGGYRYASYLGFADIIPNGATLTKLEVYLKNAGNGTPGTQGLANHQLSAKPTGSPPAVGGGYSVTFANGQARWTTIPPALYANWASNTYLGVVVGSTSNSALPWQRFYRSGTYRPVLRATYTI